MATETEINKIGDNALVSQVALLFCDTLRPELSWSHYRRLISVETN